MSEGRTLMICKFFVFWRMVVIGGVANAPLVAIKSVRIAKNEELATPILATLLAKAESALNALSAPYHIRKCATVER
jgi:hypothetical protein